MTYGGEIPLLNIVKGSVSVKFKVGKSYKLKTLEEVRRLDESPDIVPDMTKHFGTKIKIKRMDNYDHCFVSDGRWWYKSYWFVQKEVVNK